ncbi:MAG: 3-isopropylmalate dehydratase large subunit [Candidatus Hydrothermarchaeota archaeon]
MGKTMAEKILSKKSGRDAYAGDIVLADVDFAMGQDGTTPLAIKSFNEMNGKEVWNGEKIAFVIDHSAPSPNEKISSLHKMMRDFAKKNRISVYDIGSGICHQVIVENGHVLPGSLVVGADSHTCTYGALGAFSTGIGSTDMAAVFISGKLWFKVPETIKFTINGNLQAGVYSKDLILYLIGKMGSDGATYMALEFEGDTISSLSMDARMTICNMAVEMGAKTGMIKADEKTIEWLRKRTSKNFEVIDSDDDGSFNKVIEVNASDISPMISCPHAVDNVRPVEDVEGIEINQAFLGTCTNGRLEDLTIAAKILKDKKIDENVRMIVAPASREVLIRGMETGIIQELIRAGACLISPGCGPCVGTHLGIPSDGENVISTANRNFKGRMGNSNSFIYLASPATVAISALHGEIRDPREEIK